MPTQPINDVLARLLDAPLKNPRLLSRLSSDRLDPVSSAIARNPRSAKSPDKESRSEHILKRLGHISVNPSDPFNTQAITGTYAYRNPISSATQLDEARFINENEALTDEFVRLLIEEAERQHYVATQLTTGRAEAVNASRRIFVLHGSRGVGKTFFLNFALSKWSGRLDEGNVVWVRIDCVKNFPPKNDLIKWIYAQTAKILLRYYDSRSLLYRAKSIDISALSLDEEIHRYLHTLPGDLPKSEMHAWVRMKEVFWKHAPEQPLSESFVSEHIARHIFHYLLNHGFKFVVILDGFDRLEATHDSSNKFQLLVQNVLDLGSSGEPIGFPLVVVMRSNTLRSLAIGTTYRRFPTTQTFSLGTPELTRIVEKRVEYLTSEILGIASAKQWATDDWPGHLTSFVDFLKGSDDGRNYVDTLNNVFGTNRRAQLQVLQLAYFDYIGHLQEMNRIANEPSHLALTDKQYKLIETMCKVGYRYPPMYYRYTARTGKIKRELGDDLGFDNRFLPSLFGYPVVESPDENDFAYTEFDVLVFLRVMQFIRSHDKEAHRRRDQQDLAVFEVTNMMRWMFGYDSELVAKLVGELIEFEVVYAFGECNDFERDLNNMRIGPLPKLNYILDRYLNDITYLALSLMRAPIGPFGVSETDDGMPAQFATISYYDKGADLPHWISTKCLNSISAYRLVRDLNRLQKNIFEVNLASVQSRKHRYPDLLQGFIASSPFDFTDNMRHELVNALEGLLSKPIWDNGQGQAPVDIPTVSQAVENYQKNWI